MRIAVYVFRFATPCVRFGQAACLHELRALRAICDLRAVSHMDDIYV
jgi:hypothetical protein